MGVGHFSKVVSFRLLLAGFFLLAGGIGGPPAVAGEIAIAGAGGYFRVPVTSLKEARFNTVIKQKFDFSCGSAALATLLTYHYDRPTGEQEIFEAMFEAGDQEKIHTYGFSLLDMKSYLETRGLSADGFRVPIDRILKVGVPAITLITTNGYRHFVLVKGLSDKEILVGDPALGAKIYRREAFEKIWGEILFMVRDDVDVGRKHFNAEEDWAVRAKAPFGTALTREGLALFTMMLPGRNEF